MMKKIKDYFSSWALFIKKNKLFTLFFLSAVVINFLLLSDKGIKGTKFYSSSTYDKGPLGSYGIFTYLKNEGFPVRKSEISPYIELSIEKDVGKTYILNSPLIGVGSIDWKKILEWVEQGNRLITIGMRLPRGMFQNDILNIKINKIQPDSLQVRLPVANVFPKDWKLSPMPTRDDLLQHASPWLHYSDRYLLSITTGTGGQMPFITSGSTVLATKQLMGKGEWIQVANAQFFDNKLLMDKSWFEFICTLLTFDSRYSEAEIIFDEYHNGFSATKDLWELLGYYHITTGIIFLSVITLLFLFFNGIRVLSPQPGLDIVDKDIIPGLKSMAAIFIKFYSFRSLILNELKIIEHFLFGYSEKDIAADRFVVTLLKKGGYPEKITTENEYMNFIKKIRNIGNSHLTKKDITEIMNTIIQIRKEIKCF